MESQTQDDSLGLLLCRVFHWTNLPLDKGGRRAEGANDHLACNMNCFYSIFLHFIVAYR
ncbi:hypothetical protein AALO_G00033970 [Alosa alosa]|uniref:Uncharacterized protein n=1 Tax=Alosa alosa TaxID=278164 RepID=A0AAV6HCS8_9TELE|nr:hypothetical protein AALO_G00033970 [Alosa alosa]